MNATLREHDVVALLEDFPAEHFVTHAPLTLKRGLVGTVVMLHGETAAEVEFADENGRAEALLPIPVSKLIPLRYSALMAA